MSIRIMIGDDAGNCAELRTDAHYSPDVATDLVTRAAKALELVHIEALQHIARLHAYGIAVLAGGDEGDEGDEPAAA